MNDEKPAAPESSPATGEAAPESVTFCSFDDFTKINLKVAEITEACDHPNADKLLKLQLKVGDSTKQICAGIKAWYTPESLLGKRIIIVDNLEPRKLRGEVSEGMLLAARESDSDRVVLITTDAPDVTSGSEVG